MSKLIVEVCAIEEIRPHTDADRIEMARVKGWWCVVGKGQYQPGAKVVYVPPDAILPRELAERWGIAKYCADLPKRIDGTRPTDLRIRASRFRGERSFGTVQNPDDTSWKIGTDVAEHYGISKYDPPLKAQDGDAAPQVPGFHCYTDIENIGNFPDIFTDGEEIVITEKIHGTNCRVGLILYAGAGDVATPTFMAGSHSVRRKEFDAQGARSRYWFPFDFPEVKELLEHVFNQYSQQPVLLFGEIFGSGVQDMQYGQKGLAFRAFDISVGGRYLDYDEQNALSKQFRVQMVPVLYKGPFSVAKVNELVDGPTTVCDSSDINESFKGREGVVIKPVKERFNGDLNGRVVLKSISVDYHDRRNKNRTEDH